MKTEFIHWLRDQKGPVSGEVLSRRFGLTRAGVWKRVRELRAEGYIIEASRRSGYRYVQSPDKLLPAEIGYGLNTRYMGRRVVYEEVMASTMPRAFQLAEAGAPEGTLVCVETQTEGRGRLGRGWCSPYGVGLYFSVVLYPETLSVTEVPQLTLMSAVALCEALREASGLDIRIKWPNDLLIKGKKVAKVWFAILGVGVNVNTSLKDLPDGAASLSSVSQRRYDRVVLLRKILAALEGWYDQARTNGLLPVRQRWKQLSATLGRRVRCNGTTGVAEDIDEDGRLMIRGPQGKVVRCLSGSLEIL